MELGCYEMWSSLPVALQLLHATSLGNERNVVTLVVGINNYKLLHELTNFEEQLRLIFRVKRNSVTEIKSQKSRRVNGHRKDYLVLGNRVL